MTWLLAILSVPAVAGSLKPQFKKPYQTLAPGGRPLRGAKGSPQVIRSTESTLPRATSTASSPWGPGKWAQPTNPPCAWVLSACFAIGG